MIDPLLVASRANARQEDALDRASRLPHQFVAVEFAGDHRCAECGFDFYYKLHLHNSMTTWPGKYS